MKLSTEKGAGCACPACGLRCVTRINWDTAECPVHGVIPGLLIAQLIGSDRIDALIEIRASQLHDWLYSQFRSLEHWLNNDSKLRISAPWL